jgi:hypothetical protein
MKNFLMGLLYEGDMPSLTRVLTAAAFILFVCVSLYLMINGIAWSHYDTFAYITGAGGIGGKLFDNFLNSKFNSPLGISPKK